MQEKRKAVLDKFFTSFGPDDLKSVLADDVSIFQAEEKTPLGKEGQLKSKQPCTILSVCWEIWV